MKISSSFKSTMDTVQLLDMAELTVWAADVAVEPLKLMLDDSG